MQKHTKIYMNHWGYGEQDVILCENCGWKRAADCHHLLFKSQGGKDEIENLMALCRNCHVEAHRSPVYNKKLKEKHLIYLR